MNYSILFERSKRIRSELKKADSIQYLTYTILKYVEMIVMAYISFSFANLITPTEYGMISKYFVLITYSSFAALGINQVLLKWYSISDNQSDKNSLETYSVVYNFLVCIILFLGVFIFTQNSIVSGLSIALICSLKIIQECFNNIYRVKNKIYLININSLIFSLLFLFSFIFYVKNGRNYFNYWSTCIGISILTGLAIYLNKNHGLQLDSKTRKYIKDNFKNLIFDGFKLSIIVFVTPWISTIDRVIMINFTKINYEYIGTIQLADNISSVITMGMSTIIFIYTPQLLSLLYKKEITIKKFYLNGLKIALVLFGLFLLFLFPMKLAIGFFFPNYSFLFIPLAILLFAKILLLVLIIPNLICIAFSKEARYIVVTFGALICLMIIYFMIAYLCDSTTDQYLYFPISLCLILIFLNLFFYWDMMKMRLFYD